ncbi:hypothetical protein SFJ1713_0755 [Shigella flexneri SFJ17B]|nr:hypothetical protein SFJ1713_0755 [Shigella flexneri SFJ17B]
MHQFAVILKNLISRVWLSGHNRSVIQIDLIDSIVVFYMRSFLKAL